MMTGVLRELNNACIVVDRDLKILHANKTAHKYFGRKKDPAAALDFSDLPPTLGTKIYHVLKTGAALGPFRYEPENAPGTIFKIGILPFQHGSYSVPASALLTAEDLTESEQLKTLEAEAAKLRLLNRMSDRLAQEAGTAVTPIDAAWQLLSEKLKDTTYRDELDAMSVGIKRLERLTKQMRILGREGHLREESFAVGKLVEESFQEAAKYQGARKPQFKFHDADLTTTVNGDREALKQALFEVMLNALQANSQSPRVTVSIRPANSEQEQLVAIEVQDNGTGFTAESARRAPAPFDTARASGLGLGLTVSQKIIESHHGRLEIVPADSGVVRIFLPVESIDN
jgi:nitrogen-specific signal transduction histidine kinase